MPLRRRSKIVATIGPASSDPAMIRALAEAGANVFRLNFSHGSHEDHAATVAGIRAAAYALDVPLAILADLQGPKFRLGRFAAGSVELAIGDRIRLDLDTAPGDAGRVGLPHKEVFAALGPGDLILVDDGKVRLKAVEVDGSGGLFECTQAGTLSDRKGVNIPGAELDLSPLTAKDRADLQFALEQHVDYVALSFVQRAADMAELRRLVNGRARVLAKIEKPQAVARLNEILDLCDAVMVARGDLGVEYAPEEVPIAQKEIIRAARERGIPVIVATQMLDSMIVNATPTRAEASDVANAVYEGADALMLSGETAAGAHPIAAVEMMGRIIARTEADPNLRLLMRAELGPGDHRANDPIAEAACRAAETARAACLVPFTATGTSAMRLARERPGQPILALTPDPAIARRLALVWGVRSRIVGDPADFEDMSRKASESAALSGLAGAGDQIVIVAGVPFGTPGATNLVRLARATAPAR
jgi:pyruvate kinase